MTASAAVKQQEISIERHDPARPIFFTAGREWIGIYAGTFIHIGERTYTFNNDTSLDVAGMLVPGHDYGVGIDEDGKPFVMALASTSPIEGGYIGGFHFAPSGSAEAGDGGDGVPAINPHSIWDIEFRPSCPDPRGMALVETAAGCFWADIYLLGVDHGQGTSRCGATIADGRDLPQLPAGKGKYQKLDYATAVEIYYHHGKRLLGAEEFFAAAYGVKERCSREDEPTLTGALDDQARRFVSKHGLFDVTGTMWQWGTDGHPEDPRPSIFGGSWLDGADAGSRYADLGDWAELSHGGVSARGASDHLSPA